MIPTIPQPNFYLFGGLVLLRFFLILTAWLVVGVGILCNKIYKGYPERAGQWSGAATDVNGNVYTGAQVPQMVCVGFWRLYDMPDEPGIGLYEPTVSAIYNRFGWWVTVYYQLAFRNVAQGLGYAYRAQGVANDVPAPQRTWTKFGIRYGYKQYADWRSMSNDEVLAGQQPKSYYYVPDFFVSAKDAS